MPFQFKSEARRPVPNDEEQGGCERLAIEKELREGFGKLVKERTFFNLAASMKGTAKSALNAFVQIIKKIGKGTGKGAALHRQDARHAMKQCYDAVP